VDIWALPLEGRKAFPVVQTQFNERLGQFSPDGKWIAYQSDKTGRFEIYVQPFPVTGGDFPVSTNGGTQVRWNPRGRELFYVAADDRLMAVPIRQSAFLQSRRRSKLGGRFGCRARTLAARSQVSIDTPTWLRRTASLS
jgi:hypothetical protein